MNKRTLLPLMAALLLAATACTEEETDIGLGLTDPATLYNGKPYTLTPNYSYSLRDDSLLTSNYSYGIIGEYDDAMFGHARSVLYSQIGLASGMSSIDFDEVGIDSVVLTLVPDGLFPATEGSYNLHFRVRQLAQPIDSDSDYYSFDSIATDPTATFFDQTVTVGAHDTVVRLPLSQGINAVLAQNSDRDAFLTTTKGLCVEVLGDADVAMMSINFASTATCLTAYYHYGDDTVQNYYTFLFGGGVAHFTHFDHDYSGTIFDGTDRIEDGQNIYLEPLAGFNARLVFDLAVREFHNEHPLAVIHYAELLLPLAPSAPDEHPGQLVALAATDSGTMAFIPDYTDAYTYRGFDGTFDESRGLYRIRVTQHVQRLVNEGVDKGINIILDARRSSAQRTVLGGFAAINPPKIELVYTE